MSDLTKKEQANVRTALKYLYMRCATWQTLAKALRAKMSTVHRAASGRDPVSASLALRVARLAAASVDDVLAGKWPEPGTCPHCGQRKPAPGSAAQ